VDGSGASGDYATDTFHFGGKTIDDMQLASDTRPALQRAFSVSDTLSTKSRLTVLEETHIPICPNYLPITEISTPTLILCG